MNAGWLLTMGLAWEMWHSHVQAFCPWRRSYQMRRLRSLGRAVKQSLQACGWFACSNGTTNGVPPHRKAKETLWLVSIGSNWGRNAKPLVAGLEV
jgi:hypothetical protein